MCQGSIKLEIDQTTIVYPPVPEVRVPGCIYCDMAAKVAARLCPVCNLPIGYGAILPLYRSLICQQTAYTGPERTPVHFMVYSRPWGIIYEHYACWEQRQAERLAEQEQREAALQPLDPPPAIEPISLTVEFLAEITANPDNILARLYRTSNLLPAGVDADDPRLLDWRNRQLQPSEPAAPDMPKKSGRKPRKVKDIA